MTKIAIVRGLNDNRGRTVPKTMPFINWMTATAGELDLYLAKQSLWLNHHLIPEKEKIWAKGAVMIDNALSNGIHGYSAYIGALPKELQFVGKAIKNAKNKVAPAGEVLVRRSKDITKGVDLETINGINGLFDPSAELKKYFSQCFVTESQYDQSSGETIEIEKILPNCIDTWSLVIGLNEKLPKSAHQYMYQFMDTQTANNRALTTQTAATKAVMHKQVNGELNVITKVPMNALIEWQRNAIIWRNAERGYNGILSPENCIELFRKNPSVKIEELYYQLKDDTDKVGFVVTAAFIWACVGAIIAIAGLIQVCQKKEPSAFQYLSGLARETFGGSGSDFLGLGNGTEKDCPTGFIFDEDTQMCVRKPDTGDNGGNGGNNGNNTSGDGGVLQLVKENPIPTAIAAGLGLWAITK